MYSGQLIRMREDEIRIFLQEMSRNRFDEDVVIAELETMNSDLVKARLAIPPQTVVLQDLQLLNAEARERVQSNLSSQLSSTFPVLINGHVPASHVRNGHVR